MIVRLSAAAAALTFASLTGASALELGSPVQCTLGKDCFVQQFVDMQPGSERADPFCGTATYDGHDGTDFRILSMQDVKRGVPILAMADGVVMNTREGMEDKLVTNKQEADAIRDRGCGNAVIIDHGDGFRGRYCHMRQGSVAVRSGDKVTRGQTIGMVGSSGLAEFPHVEVAILKDRKPYDPMTGLGLDAGCPTDQAKATPFFTKDVVTAIGNGGSQLLSVGIAGDVVKHNALTLDGPPPTATSSSPNSVGWGWFINLHQGDRVQVKLVGPAGTVLADQTSEPMDRPKAAYSAFSGKRGSPPPGDYEVYVALIRDGAPVVERTEKVTVK